MRGKLLTEVNRMRELMGLNPLNEAEDYDEFFKQAADKFGIDPDAIDELPDDKKKEFFDYIDANWNSDSEFGDDGEVEEEGCDYKDKK